MGGAVGGDVVAVNVVEAGGEWRRRDLQKKPRRSRFLKFVVHRVGLHSDYFSIPAS